MKSVLGLVFLKPSLQPSAENLTDLEDEGEKATADDGNLRERGSDFLPQETR